DRTGSIEARVWDAVEEHSAAFDSDDIVKVKGRVEQYRGRNQLIVEKIRRVEVSEVELADFFPHTAEDVEKLYARLGEIAASVQNPWLARLLTSVVDDPEIAPQLKRAPAAKGMHHAYIGGLLEHMVSLCELCSVVAARYPEVDRDLLLTGAILHDVGKIRELTYDRSFGYSTEGMLLGHILIEYEMLTRKMDAIEGFPERLKTMVQHMLISHHGKMEFGSPKLPMFREALLLHYLDDLDSKMAAIRSALSSADGEGDWTARSPALERRFLRGEAYLNGASREAAAPEQLKLEAPAEKSAKAKARAKE
ncbi:MAG TPA: HD domain-containing protein, partial [Candidatus Acidoferrales bacterium]